MLIIGASGFVGQYLYHHFSQKDRVVGTYHSKPVPGFVQFDVTNKAQVDQYITAYKPEIILLPASNPNVEWCQDNGALSWQINVEGMINVAKVAKDCGSKLVYYSTEYVFDGCHGPYSEEDSPHPISTYGWHKYIAEQSILDIVPGAIGIRTTVVYGWQPNGKNFADKFIKTLRAGNSFSTPVDQYSSPTYVKTLVEATDALLSKNCNGLYHVVGPQVMNRYEFALQICDVFGLDKKLVIPKTTAELNQHAPRPLRAGLRIDKLIKDTMYRPCTVLESLNHMKSTQPYE